jgi:hypothetical protein
VPNEEIWLVKENQAVKRVSTPREEKHNPMSIPNTLFIPRVNLGRMCGSPDLKSTKSFSGAKTHFFRLLIRKRFGLAIGNKKN